MSITAVTPAWIEILLEGQSKDFFLLVAVFLVLAVIIFLLVLDLAKEIPFNLKKSGAKKFLENPSNLAILKHAALLDFDPAHVQASELLDKIKEIDWSKVNEKKDMVHIDTLVTDMEIILRFREGK